MHPPAFSQEHIITSQTGTRYILDSTNIYLPSHITHTQNLPYSPHFILASVNYIHDTSTRETTLNITYLFYTNKSPLLDDPDD